MQQRRYCLSFIKYFDELKFIDIIERRNIEVKQNTRKIVCN